MITFGHLFGAYAVIIGMSVIMKKLTAKKSESSRTLTAAVPVSRKPEKRSNRTPVILDNGEIHNIDSNTSHEATRIGSGQTLDTDDDLLLVGHETNHDSD